MLKIKKIFYPTLLSLTRDEYNDNIDVIIELNDGSLTTIVVSTPKNLIWQMEKENLDFLPLGEPQLIVSKIDKAIIENALYEYVKDEQLFKRLFLS